MKFIVLSVWILAFAGKSKVNNVKLKDGSLFHPKIAVCRFFSYIIVW